MNCFTHAKRILALLLSLVLAIPVLLVIYGFCGFYVAQGGAKLFNKASQVIIARKGDKTVVTMANDISGDVKEFALVVPVPVVLKREQIRIKDQSLFQVFDNYSAPRLVEYYDDNPCRTGGDDWDGNEEGEDSDDSMDWSANVGSLNKSAKATVKVEAKYSIGEYDIVLLSATKARGLETWLKTNDYNIPEGAQKVLQPYIKNNLKFFVVKVNVKEFNNKGFTELRPIQIEYEYDKFMLPIRLGMANSTGYQDLIIYGLSSQGRIETANYRTVPIPTDQNIPKAVINSFSSFYKKVFEKVWRKSGKNVSVLEYAWNVSPSNFVKCDPCPEMVPLPEQITDAGVFWVSPQDLSSKVYFTRLHLRYSLAEFPEDLMFIETKNTQNFQGRYIVNHMAEGDLGCPQGIAYLDDVAQRKIAEMRNYEELVLWDGEEEKPEPQKDDTPIAFYFDDFNKPTQFLILSITLLFMFSIHFLFIKRRLIYSLFSRIQ